jgi:hypothetical protein
MAKPKAAHAGIEGSASKRLAAPAIRTTATLYLALLETE